MTALHAQDAESWLEIIWHALHSHRETCIPEGVDPAYDDEWDNICSAMEWVREALGLPTEVEAQRSSNDLL